MCRFCVRIRGSFCVVVFIFFGKSKVRLFVENDGGGEGLVVWGGGRIMEYGGDWWVVEYGGVDLGFVFMVFEVILVFISNMFRSLGVG